jgi:predicted amidohydrolase YtcJ
VSISVERAHSIAEFVGLIHHVAATVPSGQWIQTTNAWNQANLAEQRPPTAAELDESSVLRRSYDGVLVVDDAGATAVRG